MRTLVFLFAAAALAQTPQPDTPALQALLNEVHQLRVDMQTTAVTMQRVQIVLYRLQSQTTFTSRADSAFEGARTQLGFAQTQKKNMSSQLEQMQSTLRDTQNQTERKHLEEAVPQMKIQVDRFTNEEQRLQSVLIDAENQHRAERAKLADLEGQLERLDKVLDGLSRK